MYPDSATVGTFPKDKALLNLRNGLKIMCVHGDVCGGVVSFS